MGERIITTGRVTEDGGRAVPGTLIEIWQTNSAGRYVHTSDQHNAPDANAPDPVLNTVPAERRSTLLGSREEAGNSVVYRFDIHMQGERETVLCDL